MKTKSLILQTLIFASIIHAGCGPKSNAEKVTGTTIPEGNYFWSCGSSNEKIVIGKDNSIKLFIMDKLDYSKINANMDLEDIPVIWQQSPYIDSKYKIEGTNLIIQTTDPDTLRLGVNSIIEDVEGTLGIDYRMECMLTRVYYKH
jgi:hypothetical protein